MKDYKQNLKDIKNILNNYISVMLYAIETQNEYLERLSSIVEVYDYKGNDLLINAFSNLNEKLITQLNKLNNINTILLKIKRLDQMLIAIEGFKVFDLDETVIPALEKQKSFIEMCERKNFVSSTSKACFQQTSGIISCLYLTSIKQLEICRDFINIELEKLAYKNDNDLIK